MSDAPAPRLRLVQGKSPRTVVEIAGRAVIGRLGTVEVPISDAKASREHARVFEQAGAWHIVDLNSTNGTLVNGTKITRRALRPGDEITIGTTVFVFEMPEPPPPARPAAPAEPVVIARPVVEPRPAAAPSAPAGATPVGEIVVKQRSLHFHRIEAGKKVNPLLQDVGQRSGLFRLVVILVLVAIAAGLFFLAIWIGKSITAPDDEPPPAYEGTAE